MKKKLVLVSLIISVLILMAGCGKDKVEGKIDLPDGNYMVDFDTDSSMFHVNEAMEGKALLTVTNKSGNLHLVMPSKNVLNLYSGLAENAKTDEANWINPGLETVTYSDGMTEEVYTFDVFVTVLDEEFDLALIGKKEVWYDHKVSISNPVSVEMNSDEDTAKETGTFEVTDGSIELTFEGGTGKVSLQSPTSIKATDEGYLVTLVWSSKNYDYMIVDGEKYLPLSNDGQSVFEIPVNDISKPLTVIADTVAMSTPHEIEYVITFNLDSLK